jgi:hypothetical protein
MTDEERRARVQNAGDEIGRHLAAIEALFVEPVFVTLVIRNPGHPDGSRNVLLTNDPDRAAAAATLLEADSPTSRHFDIEVDRDE